MDRLDSAWGRNKDAETKKEKEKETKKKKVV